MLERKREAPDWFYDRPELFPGQEFYIDAFDQLTTCRLVTGGSVGRIPWTAVHQYAEVMEMDYYEFLVFQQVIAKLDSFYVSWVYDQMKREAPDA
jgi:hypothetical protein